MTNKQNRIQKDVRAPHELCGLPPDTPILLGFSGGADSSALLHVLLSMREEYGFSLTLAHLDHGIRGEEAARDRAFCEAVAAQRGLDIVVERADVPALAAASGASLEEAARNARYAFFARIMAARDIPILVTAHHATDNLETLLFRLSRGTGSRGLCGIRPSRPFAGGFLVRPMLSLSARTIRAYCKEHRIDFVTDSTNEELSYSRNRIRHELLPLLEGSYPGVEERAARLSRELCEDNEYLDALADAFLQKYAEQTTIPLSALREAPPPILRRALLGFAERAGAPSLMHVHLDALLSLVRSDRETHEVRLGHGLFAFRKDGMLCVAEKTPDKDVSFCKPFSLGEYVPDGTNVRICVTRVEDGIKVHNLSTVPYIILNGEFDIINKGAYWRERRAGDVLLLRGMHRKLRKLQNEAGIAPRKRRTLPILCDGEGVLWAPMVGHRDGICVKTPSQAKRGDLLIRLVYENT